MVFVGFSQPKSFKQLPIFCVRHRPINGSTIEQQLTFGYYRWTHALIAKRVPNHSLSFIIATVKDQYWFYRQSIVSAI